MIIISNAKHITKNTLMYINSQLHKIKNKTLALSSGQLTSTSLCFLANLGINPIFGLIKLLLQLSISESFCKAAASMKTVHENWYFQD